MNFSNCFLFLLLFPAFCFPETSQAPLSFTENKGQLCDTEGNLRPDLLYYGEANGMQFYIRNNGISYVQHKTDPLPEHIREADISTLNYYTHRIDLNFINSNSSNHIISSDALEGYKNYYYPHCPEGITRVPGFNTLVQKNIYNNIDIIYKGSKQKGLKYDIVVHPGGNPGYIKIQYSGADKLKIVHSLGEFTESMPRVYQNIDGKIVDVEAEYKLSATDIISFSFGEGWDEAFPLVIDPWVTYFGGVSGEQSFSITTDNQGNTIFTGYTTSVNFPVLGAFQGLFAGAADAFCAKLDDGGMPVWSTYYGGSNYDAAYGICSDILGNIYFTGSTRSPNFPIGVFWGQNSYLAAYPGSASAFIVKLNAIGARVWSSTYYGDASGVTAAGLSVTSDITGDMILYGDTRAHNNISTAGVFQVAHGGGLNDVFVAKFSSAGLRLWASYCGGSGVTEGAGGVSCDVASNIYITGVTNSTDFPVSMGAHQVVFGGGSADAFLFKFTAAGQRAWATYYGGNRDDNQVGTNGCVKVDLAGDVYIAGSTNSNNGNNNRIATPGSFQFAKSNGAQDNGDAYLAKFNAAGTRLWGTYLGGATAITDPHDYATGLTVDKDNNIIVGGDTYARDFPVTNCSYITSFAGSEMQFITTFQPNGALLCSGYLGIAPGPPDNETQGVSSISAFDNYVYMTLTTTHSNYPVTSGAYQQVFGGEADAVVAKLCTYSCGLMEIKADFAADKTMLCNVGEVVNFTLTNTSCEQTGTSYLWSFSGAVPATSTEQNPAYTYEDVGCYDVMLVVQNQHTCADTAAAEVCITPEYTLYVPNAFTPNDDGHNDMFLPYGTNIDAS